MTRVLLIVEDEASRVFLTNNLCADGFAPVVALTAEAGMTVCQRETPALALVDVNGGSGREFARAVRAGVGGVDCRLPLILLGRDAHEIETLRAFDAGADDYVPKPFAYPELHARARALLRRVALDTGSGPVPHVREVGPLRIDRGRRVVTLHGEPVAVTHKELELLWMLAEDPERVVSKDVLLRRVWGHQVVTGSRAVDTAACRLRSKLGGGYVVNSWGLGYRLCNAVPVAS